MWGVAIKMLGFLAKYVAPYVAIDYVIRSLFGGDEAAAAEAGVSREALAAALSTGEAAAAAAAADAAAAQSVPVAAAASGLWPTTRVSWTGAVRQVVPPAVVVGGQVYYRRPGGAVQASRWLTMGAGQPLCLEVGDAVLVGAR